MDMINCGNNIGRLQECQIPSNCKRSKAN